MIIVGTHLDKVAEGDAVILERKALERFSDTSIYPKVRRQLVKYSRK